jgi:hypothetical protein
MVAKSLGTCLFVGLLLAGTQLTLGAVPSAEDFTGCRLPNKSITLPVAGSPASVHGPMYKFAKNEFSAISLAGEGHIPTPDDVVARIRADKSADVQYLPDKGGSLWAFSGAISQVLDTTYLSDISGKPQVEPMALPKTTANYAGQLTSIMEGGIYLLKTTDARYVLLRVLEKTDNGVVIQYVYQPDGSLTFDIPAHAPMPYQRPFEADTQPAAAPAANTLSAAPTAPLPPAKQPATTRPTVSNPPPSEPRAELGPNDVVEPGVIRLLRPSSATTIEPTMDTFTQQRAQMIQHRMDIIAASARTPNEIDRKAQAIAELAGLHADEAIVADLLISEINFLNTRNAEKEFSKDAMHPCYAALKRMGKTGSTSALKALGKLNLSAPGEGIESPAYKAKLLADVVRGVEGADTAEFIFKREAANATDDKTREVFESLVK